MAREVIIRIRDDLDPESLADKTVPFAYNGTPYEIDLTAAHADEFDALMARYIAAGREVKPQPQPTKGTRRKYPNDRPGRHHSPETLPVFEQRTRIREWARQTGFNVSDTGLLARRLIKAYAETHPDDKILPGTWCKMPKRRHGAVKTVGVSADDGAQQNVADVMYQAKPDRADQQREWVRTKPWRDGVRAWCNAHGHPVAAKSIIPNAAMDAYRKAHPQEFDAEGRPIIGGR